ncbi:RDD family protein [Hymenobacter sp. NST-14]|uniref:RDD family protein n=1 Tax=Hymenobacter piscis TaxID=2839984 RepID=UPI001C023E4E|nr:RDD family protein [Hymenobacter piscis]MBT9391764.1 RDD family protein [Hymenobacter piscis]
MEASKWRRLINWLIDNVLVLALLAMLTRLTLGANATQLQLRLTSMSLLFGYYVLTEFYFQRSLGKVLTHTLVVNQHDERPTLGAILLRTLCRFIPLEPLSLLFSRNSTWHDTLSRTKVVFISY